MRHGASGGRMVQAYMLNENNMNLPNLSQRERRSLESAIRGILFDQPEFTGLREFSKALKAANENTEDWKIGQKYLEIANQHGLDDGYAEASDYYFAVVHGQLRAGHTDELLWHDKEKTKPQMYIELVLCSKFNWYLNGQSYRIHDDGSLPRNFDLWFTEDADRAMEQNWGDTAEDAVKLRELMLKAGVEEKPELAMFWHEACDTKRLRYED